MDFDGAEWGVEAGPIASMKFREQAVKFLDASLDSFDRVEGEKLLKEERVRVVEGISETTAQQLSERLGKQATLARAVRGPTPTLGLAGAFKGGMPVLGLLMAPVLGFFVHPVGWLVGFAVAAGLAWKNSKTSLKVLGTAPVGSSSGAELDLTIGRYVALKAHLNDAAFAQVGDVVRPAIAMIAWSADPDDMLNLAGLGSQGLLASSGLSMIQKAVHVGQGAEASGRKTFDEEEIKRLAGLQTLAVRALANAKRGNDVEMALPESSLEVEMEALEAMALELEN